MDPATTPDDHVAQDLVPDDILHRFLLEKAIDFESARLEETDPEFGRIMSEFRDGLRVTDEETLEIVRMVLVGKINRDLVGMINREALDATVDRFHARATAAGYADTSAPGERPEQRVPMSRLRARVAERLLQSQSENATAPTRLAGPTGRAARVGEVEELQARRVRRRHDRDEGHRQRLRAGARPPDGAGARPPRAAGESPSLADRVRGARHRAGAERRRAGTASTARLAVSRTI